MKTHKTNRKMLLGLALLLALALLLPTAAGAELPKRQQAETGPSTAYGAPHTDQTSTPTGVSPNAYRFTGDGGIRFFFNVDAGDTVNSIVVRAKIGGTSVSPANLVVVADGVNLGSKTITSSTYAEYSFAANLAAGQRVIDVYAQDMQTGDKLIYDWVELRGTGTTPTAACADGIDNDSDGAIDFPADPGCTSSTDDTEANVSTGGSASIVGAGDISSGSSRDNQTGDLVRQQLNAGAVSAYTTGDNAYPDGTYSNYKVYNGAWGSFKAKTHPTFGNHDYYASSTAAGANQYWNEAPAVPVPGGFTNANSYYAKDVAGTNWREIHLNSQQTEGPNNQAPSCAAGSAQIQFLQNQLNTTKNTVLFWHHARFSRSADHPTAEGATGCSKTFYDIAHDNGADLVLEGHSHLYERYSSRDKSGAKTASGLTSIVCGTGGNGFDTLGSSQPAPDKAFTNAWGVCKLTLGPSNAQVQFLPAPGSPGSDSATVALRP
jgi:hypothetical protein